ncbi:MAG: replication protein RepA [Rhodopila sp.]
MEHQRSLFDIHDLIASQGAAEAVEQSRHLMWDIEAPLLPSTQKALAARNGRRIADTASDAIIREHERAHDPGYTYSAWCLAGLPHREHPIGEDWLIGTDYAQLLVRPGVRVRDDGTREPLAVPSGTTARLLLIDLQSEALETGNRDVELGPNPQRLIDRLGLTRGGPVSRKIVDHLERLCRCSLDFKFGSDQRALFVNERLVDAFEVSRVVDKRAKRPAPMIERLRLSAAFFAELQRHPIPVDRAAIRNIQSSPRAIDIYLWLAFRLPALQAETPVSWSALWRQFGRERMLRTFRAEFREPLGLALAAYKAARVEIGERGLVLLPSPAPIQR